MSFCFFCHEFDLFILLIAQRHVHRLVIDHVFRICAYTPSRNVASCQDTWRSWPAPVRTMDTSTGSTDTATTRSNRQTGLRVGPRGIR